MTDIARIREHVEFERRQDGTTCDSCWMLPELYDRFVALAEYVLHDADCASYLREGDACDCGLSKLLPSGAA